MLSCFLDGLIDDFSKAKKAVLLIEKNLHRSRTPVQVCVCINANAHSFQCAGKKQAVRSNIRKSEDEKKKIGEGENKIIKSRGALAVQRKRRRAKR